MKNPEANLLFFMIFFLGGRGTDPVKKFYDFLYCTETYNNFLRVLTVYYSAHIHWLEYRALVGRRYFFYAKQL